MEKTAASEKNQSILTSMKEREEFGGNVYKQQIRWSYYWEYH